MMLKRPLKCDRKKQKKSIITSLICLFILFFTGLVFVSTGQAGPSLDNSANKIFPILLPEIKIVKGVVKRGDTLSSILNSYASLRTIYTISETSEDIFSFTRIKKGQKFRIILQDDLLAGFEYEIDTENCLVVQKNETGFQVSQARIDYEIELELVSATIEHNLFGSVRKVGEKNELARKMADIFAWDIDFIRDIQKGDRFRVLVEKRFRDGKHLGYGHIQAAFFMNKGTLYQAFLHKDSRGVYGYYDENGNSLQKAFLKAPLAFSRISSGFSKRRLHPILNEYRAHHGVDYAAPVGTPIKTVGDGTIISIGYGKGPGNYISVRHPNGYIAKYFHMNRFAKGMKKNKRIRQGQIIGYVGQTGWATGPHLCFRLIKNGRFVDPLKHKSPSAKPVEPEEMEAFLAKTIELYRKLVISEQIVMADTNTRQDS